MLRGTDVWSEADKYDAILIDEGHDFEPDWFRCAVGQLRGDPSGELMIAVDGAQSLYGRDRSFTWKSVGVQAVGRTRRLSRNYRNTKQILEFAWQVAQSAVPDDPAGEANVRVLPTKASRREPTPAYQGCDSAAEEHALIARLVRDFRSRGLAESEIAMLYPRKDRGRIDALCRALGQVGEVCWVSNEGDPDGGVRSLARPGVRLMTIHAAKGLEFAAVIVSALDQLPNPFVPDEVRDSNLLYVGLTRATDDLVVTWASRSAFTERVLRSNKPTSIPD
jgi:superfamily I DNA/RNA helicase